MAANDFRKGWAKLPLDKRNWDMELVSLTIILPAVQHACIRIADQARWMHEMSVRRCLKPTTKDKFVQPYISAVTTCLVQWLDSPTRPIRVPAAALAGVRRDVMYVVEPFVLAMWQVARLCPEEACGRSA